jgi:HPt (histidine-containing phosphotransfer) domain-containing protein
MSQEENDLQKVLATLRADYAKQLPQKITDLTEATQRALKDPSNKEQARSLAHKLRGTGGSYGFHKLSEAAGKLEDLLRAPTLSPDDILRALEKVVENG